MSQNIINQISNDFYTAWGNRQAKRKSFQIYYNTSHTEYRMDIPVKGTKDTAEKILGRFIESVQENHSLKDLSELHVSTILGTF